MLSLDRRRDDGAAMLTSVFFVAVLSALSVTVGVMTVNNVGNAARDRQASAALALSEGGVAQAVSYIRSGQSIRALRCAPNCGTANPWGEQPARVDSDSDPAQVVTVATGEQYEVWIEPLQPLDVSSFTPGTYRVHSTGTSSGNPGNRSVQVDVEVSPFEYPLAVYGDRIEANGSSQVFNESIFSTGCVFKRSQIYFGPGVDVVYGIPPAVHTSSIITDANATGSGGCSDNNKAIHNAGHPRYRGNGCNDYYNAKPDGSVADYRYDQDALGASPVGSPCFGAFTGISPAYPQTSHVPSAEWLESTFKMNLEGLTADQLELLKSAAIEQGFYFTDTTAIPAVLQSSTTAAPYPNPILFYDLQGSAVGGTVNLNGLAPAYSRASPLSASDSSCTGRAAFVVVMNGNVLLNSNSVIAASVFAMGPNPTTGKVGPFNGTGALVGTVYGRYVDLSGTLDIRLDECFVENPPGQALEVEVTDFVEVDRPLTP